MFEADWASIGPGSQWHLKQLGWRKINWTSGADVSSDGMAWSKLGRNERESAKALGFTEKTWTVLNDFARAPLRCMVLARGALRVSVAAAGTQRSAAHRTTNSPVCRRNQTCCVLTLQRRGPCTRVFLTL